MSTNNAVNVPLSGSTGTVNFVGSTSPTIATPVIAQINDALGNPIFAMVGGAGVVNYIEVLAGTTGQGPLLAAVGTDADINLRLYSKGTGTISLNTTATTPFVINSGTTMSQVSNFAFPNAATANTYTFPDATGTVQLTGATSLITAPAVSAASTLALGTAYQNTLGYDIVLTVYVSVTAATAGSLSNGVGPTTTPTQQTIVSALTVAAVTIIPVTIYLPSGYYALLSTGGTITATISGQQGMPV